MFNSSQLVINSSQQVFNSGQLVFNSGQLVSNSGQPIFNLGQLVFNFGQLVFNLGQLVSNLGQLVFNWGQNVVEISGSVIWSKILMEVIFNPCSEFRLSPEGPVNQIHAPHLLAGVPVIFSDLLRLVQMLTREWGAESNEKLPHLFIPSKTAT